MRTPIQTKIQGEIALVVSLELNEVEARALDALIGYGVEPFLKVFYQHLGKAYLQPHEAGLISLFTTIGSAIPSELRRVDDVRKFLNAHKEP